MEDTEETVEITVVLTKATIEKLRELTSKDSNFSEYLTMIIQRQYSEQRVFGATRDIETVISLAENLANQNRNYHTEISTLREQYNRLAANQEDLLATVEE